MGAEIYRSDVMCEVRYLTYNFPSRCGELVLADGQCTDMGGCIGLFQKIDPNVAQIVTKTHQGIDTIYWLINGQWQATHGEAADA